MLQQDGIGHHNLFCYKKNITVRLIFGQLDVYLANYYV
jgi:hypothetical protein